MEHVPIQDYKLVHALTAVCPLYLEKDKETAHFVQRGNSLVKSDHFHQNLCRAESSANLWIKKRASREILMACLESNNLFSVVLLCFKACISRQRLIVDNLHQYIAISVDHRIADLPDHVCVSIAPFVTIVWKGFYIWSVWRVLK